MKFDIDSLCKWLTTQDFKSGSGGIYRVDEATKDHVIFGATSRTKRVMLPLKLVLEWLSAYESGRIKLNFSSQRMREVVRESSEWAKQLHSFDSHLAAVVRRWSEEGLK